MTFFQRGYSLVLVKNWLFLHLFILGNIHQENLLEGKNGFLSYKNNKSPIIYIFQKGLVHAFGQKSAIFPSFYFSQANVFYNILERKNGILSYKNNRSKESRNWHFSKGVIRGVLDQNWPYFHVFILGNIGQENVFCNIPAQKNGSLRY